MTKRTLMADALGPIAGNENGRSPSLARSTLDSPSGAYALFQRVHELFDSGRRLWLIEALEHPASDQLGDANSFSFSSLTNPVEVGDLETNRERILGLNLSATHSGASHLAQRMLGPVELVSFFLVRPILSHRCLPLQSHSRSHVPRAASSGAL